MTHNTQKIFSRYTRHMKHVAMVLLFAVLGWGVGFPFFIDTSSASQLTSVSATASSSAPSVSSSYIIRFTTINAIGQTGAASTTRVTFDPTANSFDLTSLATATDVFIARTGGGLTLVASVAACSVAANEIYVSQIGRAQPPDFVEFTTCTGDTIAAGAITINLANSHVTNPAAVGSYIVRIGGTMTDSGDARVSIVSTVTVSATVDTNLTFTIAGVASSSAVNGDTTSTTTVGSATAIGFGRLSVGTSSIAAQDITVATNALNGFSVTLTESGDMSSSNGANINAFKDGNAAYPPVAWTTPVGTVGNANSYGHMGVTSEDSSLPAGDEFGAQLYTGLTSTSTRTVLYNTGPADGVSANVGATRVGYRIQISALQEAATDYSTTLTYVCTPVF
jgi:hypothetical protein